MEWFYYSNKKNIGTLLVFFIPIILAIIILLGKQSTPLMISAADVKVEQNKICIDMYSDTLADLLKTGKIAAYVTISKPKILFGGQFRITSKGTPEAQDIFKSVFVCGGDSNSLAYKMQKDYSHIFEYDEEKMTISLASHDHGKFTTVPAWLLVNLMEDKLIRTPN